jgi:hypothetical protein
MFIFLAHCCLSPIAKTTFKKLKKYSHEKAKSGLLNLCNKNGTSKINRYSRGNAGNGSEAGRKKSIQLSRSLEYPAAEKRIWPKEVHHVIAAQP